MSMIRQAQEIGGRMKQIQAELKQRRAVGRSGGEMVEVEVNGLLEVLACRIQQQLIDDGDRELLEDMIVAAMNQAVEKGRQLHADAIKEATGNMNLPGLDEAISKLTGGQPPS